MLDFDAPLLPNSSALQALDHAQERGFRAFLSGIGHNAHSTQHRNRASHAVPELERSLRRNDIPDYNEPYVVAAYMVRYHLGHCVLAYWAFKNLFGKIGYPDTLYVCDVGAGTGAGRVGLSLALNEHQNDVRVYFDAYEPCAEMLRSGNCFWEAFRSVGIAKPRLRYRESHTCPAVLPELPDDALRVVTAFHLSLPWNDIRSAIFDSAKESVQSALSCVSPDAGLFTCHQGKDISLTSVVGNSDFWASESSAVFDIPGGPYVGHKSHFYTHSAADLGFDVPGYESSLSSPRSYRFSMPKGVLLLRGSQRYAELLRREQASAAASERQRQIEAEEQARREQAEREERDRQRRIEAERLATQRAEAERLRREEERQRQEALDQLWATLESYRESGEVISVDVVGTNYGGLIVKWEELSGFVPFSHCRDIAVRDDPGDLAKLRGQSFDFNVLETDRQKSEFKLTRATIIRQEFWDTIAEGQHLDGVVVRTTRFGAFVRVAEAIDGLVHISELSRGWVNSVEEIVTVGQSVKVQVLDVDADNARLSLSIKAALLDPWGEIGSLLPVDSERVGIVVRVEDNKRLVLDIGDGLQGRIHVSQLGSWDIGSFQTGDELLVSVVRIDLANQMIWLKAAEHGTV